WRLKLLMVCIAATLALFALLKFLGGSRPLCDAMTNVLSVAAMYLTVRRAIEEWVLWIAVNAIEVFMWAKVWLSGEGMISVLLMWLLFLANGILIFSEWIRLGRKTIRKPEMESA
ncbi:MAG: nicotinamide mononucleotide transporter, partial [Kiritimatiellae bacterium]|nr:nicotinamide mononucleotide transporter [Kiritimatiellia bacterium]